MYMMPCSVPYAPNNMFMHIVDVGGGHRVGVRNCALLV